MSGMCRPCLAPSRHASLPRLALPHVLVPRPLPARTPELSTRHPLALVLPRFAPPLAMRLHHCRASHLRPHALLPATDEEGHQHALSFPLSTPCLLPLALSSLPCSCPPWPATLKLAATMFPCPWPPSTQMDRRTTFLSPCHVSGPPLSAPLAADAPRRRSSCRRHRGYCGRATTGRGGPSWAAQRVRMGPLVLPRHSTAADDPPSPEPQVRRTSSAPPLFPVNGGGRYLSSLSVSRCVSMTGGPG
jgi:hypothetical protein